MNAPLAIVVLAAGKGTRMKTERSKVLHALAGRSLIGHVLAVAAELAPKHTVVVLAPGMAAVEAAIGRGPLPVSIALQDPPLGTGHALMAARPQLPERGDLLVLYADSPLVTAGTLARLLETRAEASAAVAVLGMRPPDPSGYGRLAYDAHGLAAIVEERHANEALRREGMCNAGMMAIDLARLGPLLEALEVKRPKNEYYLTDIVAHARGFGWSCTALEAPWIEGIGINSQHQLAEAEALMQDRLRNAAMAAGVTLRAPETVFLSADTELGEGTEIEPYVVFGPGVRVAKRAQILPFCHLEGVRIGEGARVGPFTRVRPASEIGENAHIGNFVEVKNTTVEPGAKANHLAYLGDARVGARSNVGAGAITCNYDGFAKHRTEIGAGSFVGSNAVLIAPVSIGDGAYVAAGSAINRDVPAGSLGIARERQSNIADGAARIRARKKDRK